MDAFDGKQDLGNPVAVVEGAVGEELPVSEKGAAKYIQSVSQNLVSAGVALNTFGCMVAFRPESGFGLIAQFWFLICALSYFLISINSAGIADAIENRLAWLEMSYIMTWLQLVYIIIYSSVLALLFASPEESGTSPAAVPACIATMAVLTLTMFWTMCFRRPKPFARMFKFYGRFEYYTVAPFMGMDKRDRRFN